MLRSKIFVGDHEPFQIQEWVPKIDVNPSQNFTDMKVIRSEVKWSEEELEEVFDNEILKLSLMQRYLLLQYVAIYGILVNIVFRYEFYCRNIFSDFFLFFLDSGKRQDGRDTGVDTCIQVGHRCYSHLHPTSLSPPSFSNSL